MKKLAKNSKAIGMGAAVLAILLSTTSPARANAILNADFEAGDFSDWNPVPAPADSLFFVSGNPHSGHYAAWFGAVGIVDETISQTFETEPGRTYAVDFWVAHGQTNPQNDFNVFWNGNPILSLINASSFDYTHYSFFETAWDHSSTIKFAARDVLDYYYIDDVMVNLKSNPEPATLLLIGTGLVMLRRQRRRGAPRVAE